MFKFGRCSSLMLLFFFGGGGYPKLKDAAGRSEEEVMLGTMDIKDAFLQVPQEEPLRLRMQGGDFIVLKNLPGQRIGAKAWFDYFSKFLAEELGFEACKLNPCLLRSRKAVLLVHVDDVMVKGNSKYILEFCAEGEIEV